MTRTGSAGEVTWLPVHEPSVWLRGAISDLRRFQTADGSKLRGCPHVVNRTADRIITWLYWPELVTCTGCAYLAPEPGGAERWRCDRCHACNVGACSPMAVAPQPNLTVCFGLCDDCRHKETGS